MKTEPFPVSPLSFNLYLQRYLRRRCLCHRSKSRSLRARLYQYLRGRMFETEVPSGTPVLNSTSFVFTVKSLRDGPPRWTALYSARYTNDISSSRISEFVEAPFLSMTPHPNPLSPHKPTVKSLALSIDSRRYLLSITFCRKPCTSERVVITMPTSTRTISFPPQGVHAPSLLMCAN
jgi:hypothetical protein